MQYFVTNEVRRQSTRTIRAKAPTRARFTQRICGNSLRLVRGKNRGTVITDEQLDKYWEELKSKQDQGLIAVHENTITGPLVDFDKHPPVKTEKEEEVTTQNDVVTESAQIEATSPEKAPDKMNKGELIEYASQVLSEDVGELENLTKRQILERLK